MRSRIEARGRWMLAGLLLAVASSRGATPAELWPLQPSVASAAALDASAATMPPELAPAMRFEQVFLSIVSGAPVAEWLPSIRGFIGAPGGDPVTAAIREVARAWVARADMAEIQTVLENYYVQNVSFPAAFSVVENAVPREYRVDPWGEPWVYRLHAPAGFAKETAQRYRLGPTRYPDLGNLHEATGDRRTFTPPAWKIVPRAAGGAVALEFQSGGQVVGLIQPGGRIDTYALLYVGSHWALMAGPDQLFTIAF